MESFEHWSSDAKETLPSSDDENDILNPAQMAISTVGGSSDVFRVKLLGVPHFAVACLELTTLMRS